LLFVEQLNVYLYTNVYLYLRVHPVPAPCSTNVEQSNKVKDGGNNQNDILFSLGNLLYR
jgi:hypothetical protein